MKQQSLHRTLSYQKLLLALLSAITMFISVPQLVVHSFAETTTLAWDANSEIDLAGYKIYYSTVSASGPFTGTGLVQGSSPITAGLNSLGTPSSPSFQLSGLTAGKSYYFAVTAYNKTGTESSYSNVTSYTVPMPITYTLTASKTGQGSISPAGSIAILKGESKTFVITPDQNYYIADVKVDGASVGPVAAYIFNNIAASHTIEALFAINTFSITASAGANGAISPAGVTSVTFGASKTYTITPNANYRILNVVVNGASIGPVGSYTFSNINKSHTIQASFASNAFSITASAGASGTISPVGAVNVIFGTSKSFTVSPKAGYRIADVMVDGTSVGPVASYTFSNIDANHSIQVSFAIDVFTITAIAGTNGAISPAGSVKVDYGSAQAYTVTPHAGYQISDVKVDGVSIGTLTDYMFSNIIANHTIEASFIKIEENEPLEFAPIPSTALSIHSVDSEELTRVDKAAEYAIDGLPNTFWHTEWYMKSPACPHEIVIDLGDTYLVGGIQYLPRQDGNKNGMVKKYGIYVSQDPNSWDEAVAEGSFASDTTLKELTFSGKTGRYVRFVALSEINGNAWTSAAEIGILGAVPSIISSEGLTIHSVDSEEVTRVDKAAEYAIDGLPDTFWHTEWYMKSPACPHEIVIDMGDTYLVSGIGYLPRQDDNKNGTVSSYEIYVSRDANTWFTPVAKGTFSSNKSLKQATFSGKVGRFIKFRALSEINGNPWTSAAEINVVGVPIIVADVIPSTDLSIYSVDSEEVTRVDKAAEYAIDGLPNTFWHTEWYMKSPACPHEIVIDLGDTYQVSGLRYLPRQDSSPNGTIGKYEIYVGQDAITWGTPVARGAFAAGKDLKQVTFSEKAGRFVKFKALSEINGNPWTSAAEINLIGR